MKTSRYFLSIGAGVSVLLISIGCKAQAPGAAQQPSAPPKTIPTVMPIEAQAPATPAAPPAVPPSFDTFIKFDGETKEYNAKAGEPEAHFTFNLTNISTGVVTINYVQTSCGCTVAKLPSQPWAIAAGSNGQINVTMNLAGKSGTVTKTITVNSDKGIKMLLVKSIIQPAAPATSVNMPDQATMQKVATADRQAVFKDDCARCHVQPARDKMGQELYAAACGVCHDAEHRATMVPNLHAIPQETSPEFWRSWIAYGRPGSLMPAFAQSEGGFLTDAQIASLVNYLVVAIPSKSAAN